MKKLLIIGAVAGLMLASMPLQAHEGCASKDAKKASASCAAKCSKGTKEASASCAHGEKSCAVMCPSAYAACLDKKISADKDGNLVCQASGAVYAKAVKRGDDTVYQVDGQEFACRYKAALYAMRSDKDGKKKHKDGMACLDPASLPRDEKGNLVCKCCDMVVATASTTEAGVRYAVNGKDYDCPVSAYVAAASLCKDKCKGEAAQTAAASGSGCAHGEKGSKKTSV